MFTDQTGSSGSGDISEYDPGIILGRPVCVVRRDVRRSPLWSRNVKDSAVLSFHSSSSSILVEQIFTSIGRPLRMWRPFARGSLGSLSFADDR